MFKLYLMGWNRMISCLKISDRLSNILKQKFYQISQPMLSKCFKIYLKFSKTYRINFGINTHIVFIKEKLAMKINSY